MWSNRPGTIIDVHRAGEPLTVRAWTSDPSLALDARFENLEDGSSVTTALWPAAAGAYTAEVTDLPAGTYRLTVEPTEPGTPVTPVTEFLTVWA